MRYVLDTNVILFYLKDEETKSFIEENFGPFREENDAVISVVTIAEIKSISKKNKWGKKRIGVVEKIFDKLVVVNIEYGELLDIYSEIDAFSQGKLENSPTRFSSKNMGKNDLWIAATTVLTKSKLITSDKDFMHLDGEYFDVLLIDREEIKNKLTDSDSN